MSANLFLYYRDDSLVCMLMYVSFSENSCCNYLYESRGKWLPIHVIDIGKVCLLNISTERYIVTMKRHSRYTVVKFYRLTVIYIIVIYRIAIVFNNSQNEMYLKLTFGRNVLITFIKYWNKKAILYLRYFNVFDKIFVLGYIFYDL